MSKIISLSEAASIAIHSLVLIAKSEETVNAGMIADATGSSRHHVAKVLQRLVKDGFLSSSRGPGGGFDLRKKAEDVSLLDIYESVEGKLEVQECPMNNPVCPFEKCLMGNVVKTLTNNFRDYLASQKLDAFIAPA